MAAVRGEGDDLPARCISLLQEVKDLIEARSSGPENTDETAAFSSSERQARSSSSTRTVDNSREITPPSRELCRILDHSSLLIQPPVPLLPLQDLQPRKNLGPFRSERPGLMTFSALGPHKLSLCRHVRKKLCCRMLGSDAGKWFLRVKELLLMWKPNWKVFSQNWKPVVGLNCWEVGHPAQNFR